MERLPSTISLIRRGGTLIAFASPVCESDIGRKNSSIRISPGCGLERRSVVVDDLDFVGIAFSPDEADPPLLIDADRMLSLAIAFECLEPVGGWDTQVFQTLCVVQQAQLSERAGLYVRRQFATAKA